MLATLLVAGVAMAGCGGSNEDDSRPQGNATPPPPDQTQATTAKAKRPRPKTKSPEPRAESPEPAPVPPARTNPQTTRAEFVRQADAACRRFRKRLLNVRPKQGGPDQQLAFFNRMAELMERSVTEIGRLERPPADSAAIERYLRSVTGTAALLRRLQRAIERKDQRAIRRLGIAMQRNAIESSRLTKRLGFKVCGSGLSTVGPA